jgi:hypothetical protein
MATIGQALTAPEAGWRRYDNTDSRIKYTGTWSTATGSQYYGGSTQFTYVNTDTVKFKFMGTKLRIISANDSYSANGGTITIDGVTVPYIQLYGTSGMVLVYEKLNLANTIHEVIITATQASSPNKNINLDAIDIDSTGYLVHPTLNQVSDINNMQVGDCIPCRYTAPTSGQTGTFSELGTCIANEIPLTGAATPDGLFYLIKTDKGTLIADRVIQTNISWDVLNAAKLIEGKLLALGINNINIRSLSGGVAYIDANGNSSLTDKSLGAWPPNNEWDKYIVNSDLRGKIIKGDDNLWHWNNNKASWTKNTPLNGMNRGDGWLGQNDRRIHNKLTTTGEIKGRSYSTSSYVGVEIGFRPIVNYVESDIASEVIY